MIQASDRLQQEALEKIRQAAKTERDRKLLGDYRMDVGMNKIHKQMADKHFGAQEGGERG